MLSFRDTELRSSGRQPDAHVTRRTPDAGWPRTRWSTAPMIAVSTTNACSSAAGSPAGSSAASSPWPRRASPACGNGSAWTWPNCGPREAPADAEAVLTWRSAQHLTSVRLEPLGQSPRSAGGGRCPAAIRAAASGVLRRHVLLRAVARGVMLGTADLRLSATHYEGCSRAMLASSNPRFLQVQRGVADCDRWLLMAVRGHLGYTSGPPNPSKGTGPVLPLFRRGRRPVGRCRPTGDAVLLRVLGRH